uniref:Beta-adaptin appendage C-terminal subdomain domain-containing protein n=1 Tax=Gorilla gorilla gorilla TaxID=9595 RepID=A0A2I2YI58_GORGO
MTDSKYFTTNKKAEIFELKAELNNEKKEKRKEAVKKVIAVITVGKDVSSVFPDIVNCMQTDNLKLKKLVYLYLMNYAKSQPDMAIIAVNSFDEHPYVRKTAAVCVAKLHDINAQMVEDQGFLDYLWGLIADSNPMVVANAVAALSEISESHPNSNLLNLNTQNINKLRTALNKGQIFMLDCLSNYNPKNDRKAQSICERVTPQLSHANSAVVLSVVKVLMKFLELLPKDSDYYNMLLKKLAPPLVTLMSGESEVQYASLRNINLIVQKRPEILKQEIKVFFVKYNDPIYVKLEKLDIRIHLASQANIAQVLAELKEYATEVNVDFVRKAVWATGRCAIKVEQSAEHCVSTLLDLIKTKVNYVVQEVIAVIRDIFRKYSNKYESIIATLCENLDSLDEPDARSAMIWILLESFLEGFHDENTQEQLTLLTLVQQMLTLATQDSDNPDLRERGYTYWALLSADPVTAKEVVLSEKPLISQETELIEPTALEELICHIGSLASVYHKPSNAFVEGSHGIHRKHLPIHHGSTDAGDSPVGTTTATNLEQPQVIPSQGDLLGSLLNLDLSLPINVPQVSSMQMGAVDLLGGGLDSLVGQSFIPSSVPATFAPSPTPAVVRSGLNDLFELSTGIGMAPGGYVAPKAVWLPAVKAKGLEISGTFTHRQGVGWILESSLTGVIPSTPLAIHTPLMPNQSIDVSLSLNTLGGCEKQYRCLLLQLPQPTQCAFVEGGKMEHQVFLATWKNIPNENELQFQIKECHLNADTVSSELQNNNVYTIAKRNVEGRDILYQSLKLTNGIWILAELRVQPGNPNYTLSRKCRAPEVSQYIYQVHNSILKN